MAGILSSPHRYDPNFLEGTVTSIDPIRFVCTVKTIKGQLLNNVTWVLPTGGSGGASMHFSPSLGDKVLVSTSLSYPLILGCIPRIGLPNNPASTSNTSNTIDTGNSSYMVNGYVGNPEKPKDFTAGDFAITTESGSIFTVLNSGGILAKASQLAQIFLSPFGRLLAVLHGTRSSGKHISEFIDGPRDSR